MGELAYYLSYHCCCRAVQSDSEPQHTTLYMCYDESKIRNGVTRLHSSARRATEQLKYKTYDQDERI